MPVLFSPGSMAISLNGFRRESLIRMLKCLLAQRKETTH